MEEQMKKQAGFQKKLKKVIPIFGIFRRKSLVVTAWCLVNNFFYEV